MLRPLLRFRPNAWILSATAEGPQNWGPRVPYRVVTKQYPPRPDNVFEAFRRWLSAERKADYVVTARPDEINRATKDIDYVIAASAHPPSVAVEVSSVWRTEDAGKEDAYLARWFEQVRGRVQGQVPGLFYVFLPVRVPDGLAPNQFGEDLLDAIQREAGRLKDLAREGKGLEMEVGSIRVHLHHARADASDVDYGRFYPDLSTFPARIQTLLGEKGPKLKPYKDAGMETWIVAYNTAWTVMSPLEVERIVRSLLGPDYTHVDHVAICAGSPPNDAWIQDITR